MISLERRVTSCRFSRLIGLCKSPSLRSGEQAVARELLRGAAFIERRSPSAPIHGCEPLLFACPAVCPRSLDRCTPRRRSYRTGRLSSGPLCFAQEKQEALRGDPSSYPFWARAARRHDKEPAVSSPARLPARCFCSPRESVSELVSYLPSSLP